MAAKVASVLVLATVATMVLVATEVAEVDSMTEVMTCYCLDGKNCWDYPYSRK